MDGKALKELFCERRACGFYLDNASQWWHIVWNGGFRGLFDKLAPADLKHFKTDHLSEIEQLASEKGIWLEMSILYTMGIKP